MTTGREPNAYQSPGWAEPLRAAMWSFYFNGRGLSPSFVPSNVRPIALSEALAVLPRYRDEHALIRAQCATRQLASIAGFGDDVIRSIDLAFVAMGHSGGAPRTEELPFLVEISDVMAAALSLSVKMLVAFFESLSGLSAIPGMRSPCSQATAKAVYDAVSKSSTIYSSMVVERPLDELKAVLDPQGWAHCSEVFALTYRTPKPTGCSYPPLPVSDPPGTKPWEGYLFERFEIGPQRMEHVLYINFIPSGTTGLTVDYSLHRAISYTVGILEMPGLLRQNEGHLIATPQSNCTQIEVTKTIHFGEATTWSAGGLIDFGELSNYLAPAMLAAWVDNVQLVVPCCDQPKPAR